MTKFKALVFILPVFCLLVGAGVLYYLLMTRFKEGLQYLVTRESKGKYAFDASEANVSLWNKTILLRGSELHCVDTSGVDTWYRIQIPELRFSLASWKELLLHKKIVLDSLSILEPEIGIHVRTRNHPKDPTNFHASDILNYLEKALKHFNVHSFSLKDAAFSYEVLNGPAPLHGDHISLAVSNFTRVNNEDSHLLGSDKVSISLGRQHWILPDGRQDIVFSQLTFDSKGQRFELDSFSFCQKDPIGKGAIIIHADKFFFNARHLPAIYQKEQLLLDTLTCINPVLSIPGYSAGNGKKDSLRSARFRNDLFKLVNVKFVSVIDGKLLLQDKNGRTENETARKANLSIFNLAVNPADTPSISSDSIRINLRNIEFITKDSVYQLSIDEFTFHRNDAVFRNVRFAPRQPGHSNKEILFTAPSLLLKDISIVDLLQRRLKASGGELRHPLIVMYDREGARRAAPRSSPQKMASFYQALHHVSELIDTKDLNIVDGGAQAKARDLDIRVEHLDAHILLNKFFVSDSLVDIKHAIPDLRIGVLKLASKGTDIRVNRFRFDGVRRRSWGGQLEITTADGTELKGRDIYWNVLDWDIYQQTKDIQIDSLHIDELAVRRQRSANADQPGRMSDTIHAALPVIRIGRLGVGRIVYDGGWKRGAIHFVADGLQAMDLHSSRRFFTWNALRVDLHHIGIEGKNAKTEIDRFSFDSDNGSFIRRLVFESDNGGDHIRLSVPEVRLGTYWHSSDPGNLAIGSLATDEVALAWSKILKNDTLRLQAKVKVQGRHFGPFSRAESFIRCDELDLGLTDADLNKGGIGLHVPQASLHLSDGRLTKDDKGRLTLSSVVGFTWKDAGLAYNADSMSFVVKGLSGFFRDDAFRLAPAVRPAWRQLVAATTASLASVHFNDHRITADAKGLSWDPSGNVLRCGDLSVIPNGSREETFHAAQWQKDYIFLTGRSLTLAGIKFDTGARDPFLRIRRVMLDGIALDASRDKRMPFRHGIEKPMPTKLIDAIHLPLRIDTISLHDCGVRYNELSVATGKWSAIPVEAINGNIINFGNRGHRGDSLQVLASALFFDGHIRRFSYGESYEDTLSAFSASSYFSDLDLTRFSAVSIPAAAVSITGGHADTVFSRWEGNKYATYGTMHFYYDNLKIKVLNKDDINKGGLMPALKTWVANLILPDKRKKASAIFMERDREKFVFNYWVKAQTSGLLSTLGVKRSAKYRKAYRQKYKQYSLPKEVSSTQD
jgi:hypothetical protein